jgi:hypothetical protein
MLNRFTAAISALACLLLCSGAASAASTVNVGILACDVSKGIGYLVVEKQKMSCEFRPTSGPVELYTGKIENFGLEIGEIKEAHLVWGVFVAALSDLQPGALSGEYLGLAADLALGLGAGANALIGGTGRGFILQPLSVEGEVGVNVAVGVGSVSLEVID